MVINYKYLKLFFRSDKYTNKILISYYIQYFLILTKISKISEISEKSNFGKICGAEKSPAKFLKKSWEKFLWFGKIKYF